MKKIKEIDKLNIIFVLMTALNFILATIVSVNFPLVGVLGWAVTLMNCTFCGGKHDEGVESI